MEMASLKTPKDKPHITPPKLAPRATAASAARAARNALNQAQRQSAPRASHSPGATKTKSPIQRNIQKVESDFNVEIKSSKLVRTQDKDEFESIVNNKSEGLKKVDTLIIQHEHGQILMIDNTYEQDDTFDGIDGNEDELNVVKDYTNSIDQSSRLQTPSSSRPQTPKESATRPQTPNQNTSRPQTPKHSSSRPQTPKKSSTIPQTTNLGSSRPQTPKKGSATPQPLNRGSSRPQTPKDSSRPTTPAHPAQRHDLPTSRPVTPKKQTAKKSKIPAVPSLPQASLLSDPHQSSVTVTQERPSANMIMNKDIKLEFDSKQNQFHLLKKELDLKQQAVLEVFDSLRLLQERMNAEGITGGGEGVSQELVVFNVADWASEEVARRYRDEVASSKSEDAETLILTPMEEINIEDLDKKIMGIPTQFANLCLEAFTARQELIDWVKTVIPNVEEGGGESAERIAYYNAQGFEMCNALGSLKTQAEEIVFAIANLSRRACHERSALVSVGQSLVREIAKLREDITSRNQEIKYIKEIRTQSGKENAIEVTLTKEMDIRRELEEERSGRIAANNKLTTAESQLRQTRLRVSKMDRQLREAEASIASLTGTVKSLEDQSRQREVQLETRARKLRESLKTGEVTSTQLAQQRDELIMEVHELKERIEAMTEKHKNEIKELNNQLKDLKMNLEKQENAYTKQIEKAQTAEQALVESHKTIEELKSKIEDLENNKVNPELPTEREMDLWAELQATKETLRITEDEVTTCKREKMRFLETLTKIAESENKVGMQQKLAAELLNKEEILAKLQNQIREMTKNVKFNEQKVMQYEQFIRDLQSHNLSTGQGGEAPEGISYADLQQEIMNLRMSMLEAVHKNEELSDMIMQKEQQLEQQDKTSRAQARVIKVREELINMLKNKETEQSRELTALQQDLEHRMKIVDEVNHQIAAKADEIQELFSTLESKQQQIHRLEKIVLALEEQQRRAQAQRTRHEEKIAALEHELAAGGNRRDRKFLFF